MSLFDDDFFSTRVSRRSRTEGRVFDRNRNLRGLRWRSGSFGSSTLRVALLSSGVSTVLVAVLFLAFGGGGDSNEGSRAAMADGQALVEASERIISASDAIRPAVVSIINVMKADGSGQAQDDSDSKNGADEGNGADGGAAEDGEMPKNESLGSGVIFKKSDGKAFIITNAHVVENAAKVQAVLVDGAKKEAAIVGKDTISDLAVLSVDSKGIDEVAELGNSDKLRVGEMVIAVGNPLGFGDSVTQGIVSFLHRIVPVSLSQDGVYDWEQEVIQTTAAINQGNSGGVLADLYGRVVGINSMKVADMGVEGIGFAIPITSVMPIIDQLMDHGKVLRPYLGLYTMDLDVFLDNMQSDVGDDSDSGDGTDEGADKAPADEEKDPGFVVPESVKHGIIVLEAVGPAEKAGMELNDIITELDGKPIDSTLELRKYLYNNKKIGESVKITFYRNAKKDTLSVKLTEKEEEKE